MMMSFVSQNLILPSMEKTIFTQAIVKFRIIPKFEEKLLVRVAVSPRVISEALTNKDIQKMFFFRLK